MSCLRVMVEREGAGEGVCEEEAENDDDGLGFGDG